MPVKKPPPHFLRGFVSGICCGILFAALFLWFPKASAQKPTQLEILHKIVSQNYYLIQKTMAFEKFNADLNRQIAERTKVKMDKVLPLTNHLQQELFNIDLKVQELNR